MDLPKFLKSLFKLKIRWLWVPCTFSAVDYSNFPDLTNKGVALKYTTLHTMSELQADREDFLGSF